MIKPPRKSARPIGELLKIMAHLRSPQGCPWDREQNHWTLRSHAVEEVYELIDAIEAGDDHEMAEELGDLLLQVVFHCQLAAERGAFNFSDVTRRIVDKLVRRHPHVFGETKVRNVDQVWANWEKIKSAEKQGTRHERASALDGVPKHLPALMRAQKLFKKARKAELVEVAAAEHKSSKAALANELFQIAIRCHERGWSAEELLNAEAKRREKQWRQAERLRSAVQPRPASSKS